MDYQAFVDQCKKVVENSLGEGDFVPKSFVGGSISNYAIPENQVESFTIKAETEITWGVYEFVIICRQIGKDTLDRDIYQLRDGSVFVVESSDSSPTSEGGITILEPYIGRCVDSAV